MTVGITELPPEGMQLGGVALAGDAERGTKTTEGLSLLFTTAGITVQGPQPQIERLLVWSGLDTASCREKIALPDGRNAAVMELTSGGQSIRFLLPMDAVTPGQAAYLDQALPAWLARYKGSVTPNPPPAPASSFAPPPAPTQSSGQFNGGSASAAPAGARASGTDTTAPEGPGAPSPAPANGAAADAAAAAGSAAASANGTTRGSSDSGSASTGFGSPPTVSPTDAGSSAARPDPSGSSFIARSATGALPPSAAPPPGAPPPPEGMAPSGDVPAPPAAVAPDAGPLPPDLPPPPPGAAAFGNPPSDGESTDEVKDKKPRGWRKNRPSAEAATGAAVGAAAGMTDPSAPGFFAPMRPPAEPPADPVPLKLAGPLPPPPADDLAPPLKRVSWKPPIDPDTGEPAWDQSSGVGTPPKKKRAWRKGTKEAAATGAAGVVALSGTAGADSGVPGVAPLTGFTPAPAAEPAPKSNRTLVTVLVVVLLVVIGGIAYFAVKRSNNNTTTSTVATPVAPRAAADAALAASVNLHLTDLPNGWSQSPSTVKSLVPAAPAAAQVQAERGLSSCLSQPDGLVAGLFGNAAIPGASAAASSPTFQDGTDAGIQMASTTTVMTSVAGAQVLAAPFASASFLSCFGDYQTALASATTPGSTASVQAVTLPVPAGVKTFGYLTTFTGPSGQTAVEGEAFIFGGRTEVRLEPTTNGPAVPQSAFASAYDAVAGRVAAAVNK